MIKIESIHDFYSMTKRQIMIYLYRKGFGAFIYSTSRKSDLLSKAIYVYKKYGV